jgi:hypothetical protein
VKREYTVHHPTTYKFVPFLLGERSAPEKRLIVGAIPKILPSLDRIRENMGEKLQWAVKNGDLVAVKALVEQVCFM